MPMYMIQFSYTSKAWAALAKHPEDRSAAVSELLEMLGGRLHCMYYTLGHHSGVLICEASDDTTVMAAMIAAHAPGHIKATTTTRLLTTSQAMEAMARAGKLTYQAPQS